MNLGGLEIHDYSRDSRIFLLLSVTKFSTQPDPQPALHKSGHNLSVAAGL
jgi:hypothetical protein